MSKDQSINLLRNPYLIEKLEHYKTWKFITTYKKNIKKIIAIGDIEIENHKFNHYKNPIF